jgi:TPP-dependent pyruvate/acetoin dehydrogenase alpha subunit
MAAKTDALQKTLYRAMLRTRMVEEKIVALYPEQEMRCPTHLCIGQEAVATGVCAALRQTDPLFGTYRSHGIYLSKGGDLNALLAEIYGKKTGACRGKSGSMQLIAPEVGLMCTSAIVGGTLPMGVGAAFAASLKGSKDVSCVLFGDAAIEEGVFHESMNFAALKKLPVVFVCENNGYAVYTPIAKRQPPVPIFKRAPTYGMPGKRFDGNDVMTVYHETQKAVEAARKGKGPSFLEFTTYRWLEHVGPNSDVHLGYRTQGEVNKWKKRDPIRVFETQLLRKKIFSIKDVQQIRQDIGREIDEAVAFAKESPFPGIEELTLGVYS